MVLFTATSNSMIILFLSHQASRGFALLTAVDVNNIYTHGAFQKNGIRSLTGSCKYTCRISAFN